MDVYPKDPWTSILTDTGKDEDEIVASISFFRWMLGTGLVTTLANIIVMSQLDPMNVLMLYPTLIFTTGWIIAPFVYQHQKGPGGHKLFKFNFNFLLSKISVLPKATWIFVWPFVGLAHLVLSGPLFILRVMPKVLGFLWALAGIILIAIGMGTLEFGFFPFSNYYLLAIGMGMTLLPFPGKELYIPLTEEEIKAPKNEKPHLYYQKHFQNLMYLFLWVSLTVGLSVIYYTNIRLFPLFYTLIILIPATLKSLNILWAMLKNFGYGPKTKPVSSEVDAPEDIDEGGAVIIEEVGYHSDPEGYGTVTYEVDMGSQESESLPIAIDESAEVGDGTIAYEAGIGSPESESFTYTVVNLPSGDESDIGTANIVISPNLSPTAVDDSVDKKEITGFFKDYGRWAFETARRVSIITTTALGWFVVVPSPALTTARLLDYNLTINYVQIGSSLFAILVLSLIILILGIIFTHGYWFFNNLKFTRIMKEYGRRIKNGTLEASLSGAIEALIMGYQVEQDSRGAIMAAEYLAEMEKILKSTDQKDYFKTVSRKYGGSPPHDGDSEEPVPQDSPDSPESEPVPVTDDDLYEVDEIVPDETAVDSPTRKGSLFHVRNLVRMFLLALIPTTLHASEAAEVAVGGSTLMAIAAILILTDRGLSQKLRNTFRLVQKLATSPGLERKRAQRIVKINQVTTPHSQQKVRTQILKNISTIQPESLDLLNFDRPLTLEESLHHSTVVTDFITAEDLDQDPYAQELAAAYRNQNPPLVELKSIFADLTNTFKSISEDHSISFGEIESSIKNGSSQPLALVLLNQSLVERLGDEGLQFLLARLHEMVQNPSENNSPKAMIIVEKGLMKKVRSKMGPLVKKIPLQIVPNKTFENNYVEAADLERFIPKTVLEAASSIHLITPEGMTFIPNGKLLKVSVILFINDLLRVIPMNGHSLEQLFRFAQKVAKHA